MDITIRLYWRVDADLIALNMIPEFNMKEMLRYSVIAWANGDNSFSIPCPAAPIENNLIIKSSIIHIQFRGDEEQYIIDKIKTVKYGWRSSFIKNLLRGYLNNPFSAPYMDDGKYTIVRDQIIKYSDIPSYPDQKPAFIKTDGKPVYTVSKKRGRYKKKNAILAPGINYTSVQIEQNKKSSSDKHLVGFEEYSVPNGEQNKEEIIDNGPLTKSFTYDTENMKDYHESTKLQKELYTDNNNDNNYSDDNIDDDFDFFGAIDKMDM